MSPASSGGIIGQPAAGFSIGVESTSFTVAPGGDRTLTVSVLGASDPTELTAVGVPPGVFVTVTPTVAPSALGTLHVQVDSAQAAGRYEFSVDAQSGEWVDTVPVALHVVPASANDGLTVTLPATLSIAQGGNSAVLVDIERNLGVTDPVILQVVNPPAGILGSFGANPAYTETSLMTIAVAGSVEPGTYPLQVDAMAGARSGTSSLMLEVVDLAAPADVWLSRVELAQTYVDDLPKLVGGKPALVRAHVLSDQAGVPSPVVRVTAETGMGTIFGTLDLIGPATVPMSEDPASFASSWTGTLPEEWVTSGLRLRVDVDPDATLAERDESNNSNTVTPAVDAGRVLDVVLVPLVIGGRTGSQPPQAQQTLFAHWPFRDVQITVRAPYVVTSVAELQPGGAGWVEVLAEVATLRDFDGSAAYYYGVADVTYDAGVAGVGYLGAPVAIGWDKDAAVMSHELGHNFGLRHAPCGGALSPDPDYPFAWGRIGHWGYDAGRGELIDPDLRDVMGYCNPVWVSGYNFRKVQSRVASGPGEQAGMAPSRVLVISGEINAGRVSLRPAQRATGRPNFDSQGDHGVVIESRGSKWLFPFSIREFSCGVDPGVRHFSVTVPDPGEVEAIEIWRGTQQLLRQATFAPLGDLALQWHEQGGQLTVRWNPEMYPKLSVVHVGATRRTLRLWSSGGEAVIPLRDVPFGGEWEFTFSDETVNTFVRRARR